CAPRFRALSVPVGQSPEVCGEACLAATLTRKRNTRRRRVDEDTREAVRRGERDECRLGTCGGFDPFSEGDDIGAARQRIGEPVDLDPRPHLIVRSGAHA
ncbi:hypothetical protein CTI14_30300, partial [Methylobacterium radiotolerans]